MGCKVIAAQKVNPESVGQLHRLPKQGKLRKGQCKVRNMRRGKSHKARTNSQAPAGVAGPPKAVNKTELIRLLIQEWTQAGLECVPKALREELKRRHPSEQWTLPYLYSIKSKLKKRRPAQAPPASRVVEASQVPDQDPIALVLAVKNLAKQAGGLDRLKRLIEALQSED